MTSISRRAVLGGTVAAAVAGATTSPAHAADVQITDAANTIRLVASPDTGEVRVIDGAGVQRFALTTFEYASGTGDDKVTLRTTGITSVEQLPGAQQFTITYAAPVGQVVGVFTVGLRKARIRWDVTNVTNLRTDSFRVARVVSGTATEHYDPVVLLNRDRDPDTGALRGGVPFETTNGVCYSYTWSDNRAVIRFPQSTLAFSNNGYLHAIGDASGFLESTIVLGSMRPHSAGVIARDGDLGIELWTDQPFNLWNTAGSRTVKLEVVNAGLTTRSVRVDWVARDWNGGTTTGTTSGSVGARAVWNASFSVTLGARDIRFVEAVLYDGTTEAAFARTTLSTLSAYTYGDGEQSMFGMGNFAYLQEPSSSAVLGLLKLLGMKWIRTAYRAYNGYAASPGPTVDALDQNAFLHNMQLARELPWGGATTAAWADDMVGRAMYSGARYYECANELNLTASDKTPAEYVTGVLEPLRSAMNAKGATFKVMTCGLAGYPEQWIQDFGAAGGWQHVDVLAYHPGRGNYTADYEPPEPWTNETRWNFLGTLKKAIAAKGTKELWLTEAYAGTQPNRWWTDTYRHAPENVFLQLALAKAYGVRCVTWYTLNDSIQQQPMEANADSVEYHHGLLHRDLGAKPSLLAFATAARWLDQSTFLGWADLGDPDLFGLVFSTPTGKVNVLWSRKDGYVLNDDPARRLAASPAYYRTPEPWEDQWPTKTNVTVPTPAATTSVRELNCLGMDVATHQASNAQVTVTLDGSPRIFIGLALPLTGGTP
ncbi:hypothetical protein [Kribbella shirazensis]|uniref:Asl1-like glycosyl hydrolase catalytic domain-containing protein n=1 Tax=Kribbella shirazensis TaxID=1105143 RepID=A0A7X6A057_9ACTN|nr:hypothetical protein [Kribbella shirazensis]NIK56871.1 hypothetical protein [Kribbella shirazensis]